MAINSCMSEINELINQVKQATDFQTNKRILKEKIKKDLHVPYNNGLFYITPDIMAFVSSWPNEELYLEDIYENPIKINKSEFLTLCQQHYQKVMNQWHIEHEKLKRVRKI